MPLLAITGLGSANILNIAVDNDARIDIVKLEEQLMQCLREERPVFAVVGIIGSTEEGAVGPLRKMLALRQRFQAYGMSFLVHADAAWGGYFATMLPRASGAEHEAGRRRGLRAGMVARMGWCRICACGLTRSRICGRCGIVIRLPWIPTRRVISHIRQGRWYTGMGGSRIW